ncbi:MAG TPA: pirin family protein [Thermoanaerobaculia bacterium]
MTTVAVETCSSFDRKTVFETYRTRHTTLGELEIRRALPVRDRRLIGPWCFLDRYGPITFKGTKPMDVAPHPHIGLQTVSWLLDGEVVHHDSLGFEAIVRPGGVNVMTAGSGIAHSEETPAQNKGKLDGVQLWIALPEPQRHIDPTFQHVGRVPQVDFTGGVAQVFAGDLDGTSSPAKTWSDLVGVDLGLAKKASVRLPAVAEREYGVVLLGGDAELEGRVLDRDALVYLGRGRAELAFRSGSGARVLVIGGVPFRETVLMWWNFVARTPEEIAGARADWEEGRRFGPVRAYKGERLPAPPLAKFARPNPAS